MNRRNNARGNRNPTEVATNNQNQQQQFNPPQDQVIKQENVDNNENGENGGAGNKIRKFFQDRKNLAPEEKKRLDKERKARQQRRLRKMLTPKNASVTLHELQGPGMSEFVIHKSGQDITAEIVVNNVRYEATGKTKHLAKSRASEKALRDLVLAQMAKIQNPDSSNDNENEDVEMSGDDPTVDGGVPMLHLASFALYKLFYEWQSEGFDVPIIRPSKAPAVKGDPTNVPKVVKTVSDIPEDASSRHPTSLLAFMRPQIPYEDLGSNNNPNPVEREYSIGVTVDGQKFIGKARSKKNARKEAAAAANKAVFGVTYVEPVKA